MRPISALLALAAAMLAVPAWADPTPAQLEAARQAEARGAEMYAYDQAAWHSTDALQADLKKRGQSIEQVSEQGMSGYVVEPAEGGLLLVTYYGQKDGRTWAMARYWMLGSQVRKGGFLKPEDDSALSPLALKLVEIRRKAIETAIGNKAFRCTRGNLNTLVLPPRADGSFPAYVMSSAVEESVFPAGGHHLYVFDAGGKLISSRTFSKGCINVDSRAVPKEAAGYGLSHLLDPQPTEIHAFVSYNVPIKLFVIIEGSKDLWEIDRGKMTFKQVMTDLPN